ncbi:hypothetical protein FRC06_001118, partial [Ceratobasidium sp. 370]
MRLSQHLFDIQFERYLRHVVSDNGLGQATHSSVGRSHRDDSGGGDDELHKLQANPDGVERKIGQDAAPSAAIEPLEELVPTPKLVAQEIIERSELLQPEPESSCGEYVKPGLEDTNKLLVKIEGVLENI